MRTQNIDLSYQTILITGVAGFIGSNLATFLLSTQHNIQVVGIDSMNDYYDTQLKQYRVDNIYEKCMSNNSFAFICADIANEQCVDKIFEIYHPTVVVNLAAQAGVRYSIDNPTAYIESNIVGFINILEACRRGREYVKHLVYASSSSVYGNSTTAPYAVDARTDSPISLYAATKKSNELMAYTYSHLYGIPATGLRFFTVYGPAGRPDMAYFKFTDKLVNDDIISLYNNGNCLRDFTYVDDIVEGISRVMVSAPEKLAGGDAAHIIYNIGNSSPVGLLEFVTILSEELIRINLIQPYFDLESHIQLVDAQPGDVTVTYADVSALERDFMFHPNTPLRTGLRKFVEWYAEYYNK